MKSQNVSGGLTGLVRPDGISILIACVSIGHVARMPTIDSETPGMMSAKRRANSLQLERYSPTRTAIVMAMPTANATTRDVTTMNETDKGSGVDDALSCMAPAPAVTTAAAIPLIHDVNQAEYMDEPPNG